MTKKYCDWCGKEDSARHAILLPVMGKALAPACKDPVAKKSVYERHYYLCGDCYKKVAEKNTLALIAAHGGPMEE